MERHIQSLTKKDILEMIQNASFKQKFYDEYENRDPDKKVKKKFLGLFSNEFLDRLEFLKENFPSFKSKVYEKFSLENSEFVDFTETENLHFLSIYFL